MKTLTLQECKDAIAQKHDYLDWQDYCNMGQMIGGNNDLTDQAATLFAEQDKWVSVEELNNMAQKHADETVVWPLNKKGERITMLVGQVTPPGYRKHCNSAVKHFKAGYLSALPAAPKV